MYLASAPRWLSSPRIRIDPIGVHGGRDQESSESCELRNEISTCSRINNTRLSSAKSLNPARGSSIDLGKILKRTKSFTWCLTRSRKRPVVEMQTSNCRNVFCRQGNRGWRALATRLRKRTFSQRIQQRHIPAYRHRRRSDATRPRAKFIWPPGRQKSFIF